MPRRLETVSTLSSLQIEEWVIPAGTDERRFFVLDVSPCRQKDFRYFEALDAELRNFGAEAMLHDLLQHDLTGFNVRDVPSTEALLDRKVQSFRGPQGWWYEVLTEGTCPGAAGTGEGDLSLSFLTKIGRSQSGSLGAHSIRIIWNIRSA